MSWSNVNTGMYKVIVPTQCFSHKAGHRGSVHDVLGVAVRVGQHYVNDLLVQAWPALLRTDEPERKSDQHDEGEDGKGVVHTVPGHRDVLRLVNEVSASSPAH